MVLNKKSMVLWERLSRIAEETFGEFGFPTLNEEQMKEALSIALAPKPKRKRSRDSDHG